MPGKKVKLAWVVNEIAKKSQPQEEENGGTAEEGKRINNSLWCQSMFDHLQPKRNRTCVMAVSYGGGDVYEIPNGQKQDDGMSRGQQKGANIKQSRMCSR